jgi:predicted MFS family arabinose efflux permease
LGFVNWALLVFGIASFIGNFAGGRLTDVCGTRLAMIILLVGLAISFGLVALAIHDHVEMLVVIGIWGIFAFAIPPVMQSGVVTVAQEVAPEALGTASGFNIAAFNLGISGGSFIGGRLVDGPGLTATPYAAITLALIALLIATLTLPRGKPSRPEAGLGLATRQLAPSVSRRARRGPRP